MGTKVKIKLLNDKAVVPTKAYEDDFCYDIYATSEEEVAPNVWKYGLGIALQLDIDRDRQREIERVEVDVCFTLRPRSSVWKTGMVLSSSVGTIDKGYTGEVSAVFYHVMPDMPRYKVGDKIGQIHINVAWKLDFEVVADLSKTERGDGGYGSTVK